MSCPMQRSRLGQFWHSWIGLRGDSAGSTGSQREGATCGQMIGNSHKGMISQGFLEILKTVGPKGPGGSNLSLSARNSAS